MNKAEWSGVQLTGVWAGADTKPVPSLAIKLCFKMWCPQALQSFYTHPYATTRPLGDSGAAILNVYRDSSCFLFSACPTLDAIYSKRMNFFSLSHQL